MHIVLANQWYPPESGWGGVATYNFVLARTLSELGQRVTVVAAGARGQVERTVRDGVHVVRLPRRSAGRWTQLPGGGRHVRAILQLEYSRRLSGVLRALYRTERFDVVEFAEVNGEGYFFGRAPLSPVVVRCHTPTFVLERYHERLPFDPGLTNRLEIASIRNAGMLTAPSADMAHRIGRACGFEPERIEVVPNPVDTDAVPAEPPVRQGSEFRVLYVGRFEYAKGIDVLVKAIPALAEALPGVHFVLAGYDRNKQDGTSKRAEVQAQLARAGVSERVELPGALPAEDLRHEYARADVVVVPSIAYESFSYACAQAMAEGRAVIASRLGGIPETVRDGADGLLVTPGDVKELTAAIARLAKDVRLARRMGESARRHVVQEFERCHVTRAMLELYRQAAAA